MLAGGWPTPLKNMSSSVGVTIPNICKHKFHIPNHQPDMYVRSDQKSGESGFWRVDIAGELGNHGNLRIMPLFESNLQG